jgi:hypothetical protein
MELLQIESVEAPLDEPRLLASAVLVLSRMQLMGFSVPGTLHLAPETLVRTLGPLRSAGVMNTLPSASAVEEYTAADWDELMNRVSDAIEASPHPVGEWGPARQLLGDELLASLVSIAISSLRRYASGERATPDAVAARLHEIGRIVSALSGSYNDYGIRRWFDRPRSNLDGQTPRLALGTKWSPDDQSARRVVALAESLLGSGAGT